MCTLCEETKSALIQFTQFCTGTREFNIAFALTGIESSCVPSIILLPNPAKVYPSKYIENSQREVKHYPVFF